jgi:hypothetical protein
LTEAQRLAQEVAEAEQATAEDDSIGAAAASAVGGVIGAALNRLRGAAVGRQARREIARRALYALNAAQRVASGVATGESVAEAWQRERPNLQRHREARAHRMGSARATDGAADAFGDTLSWNAVIDEATTRECADANGKNFSVTNPPRIGYPGTVHAKCRCTAGRPREGAEMIE